MNRPMVRIPFRRAGAGPVWRWFKWLFVIAFLVALALVARVVQVEIEASRLQARYLSELTRDVAFTVADGPSTSIRFPSGGPYDARLGYAQLPSFERRLVERGFTVAVQARNSEKMLSLADEGLFLPYEEKDRAGLRLFDADGTPLFSARYPDRVYYSFNAIPPLVVNALLFIEYHHRLNPAQPHRSTPVHIVPFLPPLSTLYSHR